MNGEAERIRAALRCGKPGCPCNRPAGNVHCPTHDDPNPSLNVKEADGGKTLLHDFGGCSNEAVIEELGRQGLWQSFQPEARTPRRTGGPTVTDYPIGDVNGVVIRIHRRTDKADGSKAFTWLHPDGRFSKDGETKSAELPLFGAERLHASPDGALVIVTEGEKDASALIARGLNAVGTVTGASVVPRDESLKPLLRFKVILWPDNDTPGIAHMNRIAERLGDLGHLDIRVVQVSESPTGDGAADFTGDDAVLLDSAEPWARLEQEFVSLTPMDVTVRETNGLLPFVTARELASRLPETPLWVVRLFLVIGALTLISGKPKTAGKTTLLMFLIRSIVFGEPFMGVLPERTGAVVVLTEEGGVSLNQALRRAGLHESEDVHFLLYSSLRDWVEVAREALVYARRIGAVLLAIDTLPLWAQIRGDAENNAGAAREALAPLLGIADLAVVLTFHDRKSGGDAGDSVRGSSAFTGAVDIVIDVSRPGGNGQENRRQLSFLGRFDELPDKIIIEMGEGGYTLLGAPDDLSAKNAEGAVLDALSGSGHLPEPEICEALKEEYKPGVLGKAIRALVSAGAVEKEGGGKKGDPYLYFVSPMTPSISVRETNNDGPSPDGLTSPGGHLVQKALELGFRIVRRCGDCGEEATHGDPTTGEWWCDVHGYWLEDHESGALAMS